MRTTASNGSWRQRHQSIAAVIPRLMYRPFAAACKATGVSQAQAVMPCIVAKITEFWGEGAIEEIYIKVEEEHQRMLNRNK